MRTRILLFLTTFLLITATACKQEDSTTEETTSQSTAENAENTTSGADMPWTFLTHGIYHNNVTVTVGQDMSTNPNDGHWIDFHSNGTYDYGIWDQKSYSGTWFYDHDSGLLELTPSNDQKRSEWKVMHKDRTLILQGTPKYQNNAQQIRYIRHEELPTKE